MAGLFELLSPIAEAVGFQLKFLNPIASAVAHAIRVPYGYAETTLVFLLAATLLKLSSAVWDLIAR